MFPAIKGYYEKGRIFLSEDAPVTAKTNVIVTFLPEEEKIKQVAWGSLEGKIFVSDDFDEPMEDLKDYM